LSWSSMLFEPTERLPRSGNSISSDLTGEDVVVARRTRMKKRRTVPAPCVLCSCIRPPWSSTSILLFRTSISGYAWRGPSPDVRDEESQAMPAELAVRPRAGLCEALEDAVLLLLRHAVTRVGHRNIDVETLGFRIRRDIPAHRKQVVLLHLVPCRRIVLLYGDSAYSYANVVSRGGLGELNGVGKQVPLLPRGRCGQYVRASYKYEASLHYDLHEPVKRVVD
jgi:hypothetical protein